MKQIKLIHIILVLLVIGLVGCKAKPEEIAAQLVEGINSQDVEAIAAVMADSIKVTIGNTENYQGKDTVTDWLEKMFLINFKLKSDLSQVEGETVKGEVELSSDNWKFFGIDPMNGTISITVVDGLVTDFVVEFSAEAQAKLAESTFASTEDLIGMWKVQTQEAGTAAGVPEEWYLQFYDDNRIRWAESPEGLSQPVDDTYLGSWLTWSFDGNLLVVQNEGSASEHYCQPEDVGLYIVKNTYDQWTESNQIEFKSVDDPCAFRMVNFPRYGAAWKEYNP